MAGLGDLIAAQAGGRSQLRASHADREQVIGALKAAFVRGMLAKDEFDVRVSQTLRARTYADLAALAADLPAALAAAKLPVPTWNQAQQPVVRPGQVLKGATALYAFAWVYVVLMSQHGVDNRWTAAALLFEGSVVYVGVLMICVAAILANRRDSRSGGQPPGPPGRRGRDLKADWG